MVLPGSQLSETVFEVRCLNCGRQVSLMPAAEIPLLMGYLLRTGQEVICFDCEDDLADTVAKKYNADAIKPADGVPACLVNHNSTHNNFNDA